MSGIAILAGLLGLLFGTGITFLSLTLLSWRVSSPERDWDLPLRSRDLWPDGQLLQLRGFKWGSSSIVILTEEELVVGEEGRPLSVKEDEIEIDGMSRFGGYAFYLGQIAESVKYEPHQISRVRICPDSVFIKLTIWLTEPGKRERVVFRGDGFDNPFTLSVLALKGMQKRILDPKRSIRRHARILMAHQIEAQVKKIAPQASIVVKTRRGLDAEQVSHLVKQ